jgi:hypothetical protein
MSLPDEEFDVLGEDELALLTRRFERLHENRVNTRRTACTCFQCGKLGYFVADCPEKTENKDGYNDDYKHRSSKDDKYRSRRDHKHKNNTQGRATVEEEGRPRQEGPSDGRSE